MNKLIFKTPVQRFKEERKIIFAQGGNRIDQGSSEVNRFAIASRGKGIRYFDTAEKAKAYQKTLPSGSSVFRDMGEEWKGSVVKTDRTKGKDAVATSYGRQQAEKYNHLSQKDAYKAAQKSGNKYFAYRGRVYKTDLNNGKDNMTEMQGLYGTHLGWSEDPKLQNKQSRTAREKYRSQIDAKQGNRRPSYQGKTNSQANTEADKQVAQRWNEKQFMDLMLPSPIGMAAYGVDILSGNLPSKPHVSGLNVPGMFTDVVEGNYGDAASRSLDLYSAFGAPGAEWVVKKMAPKIPIPTYLQQLYNGDRSSTNWVLNGLNRATGKTKNFFTRLVPTKGNGHFGKYSVATSNHISPKVTSVINNGTRQYITGNPEAVQPLYTYFGNTVTDPRIWWTTDLINQEINKE